MLEYYDTTLTVIGWILVAGSLLLAFAPLQFLLKGESPLGSDGVLHYFLAFCASLNLVWGLLLLAGAGESWSHALALPSAAGFATMSLWRIPLCRNPQVIAQMGKAPAYEVAVFAIIALYFLYAGLGV